MKDDKEIKIDGRLVRVGQVKHWPWDSAKDDPGASELNQARLAVMGALVNAWNELDASVFKDILSNEYFEYGSYWVNDTMRGKDVYLDYVTKKFETIRRTQSGPSVRLVQITEALTPPDYTYALNLVQGENETLLTVQFHGAFISSLYMTDPDIFTYRVVRNRIGVLDENGEPRMFEHQADIGRNGECMSREELHAFAVTIAAQLCHEAGAEIVSVNKQWVDEYPSIVLKHDGQLYYYQVDAFTPPNMEGDRNASNSHAFVSLAASQGAIGVILPVGLFCMETMGAMPLCGETFAAKVLEEIVVRNA